jgi:thymidylate kinase
MEQLDGSFFARVRSGYRMRAESHPARFVLIDAEQDIQAVSQAMIAALDRHPW